MKPAPPVTSQTSIRLPSDVVSRHGDGQPIAGLEESAHLLDEVLGGGEGRRLARGLAARLATQHRVEDAHPVAGGGPAVRADDVLPVDRLEEPVAGALLR